jgi:single-strand DNA-binding protein
MGHAGHSASLKTSKDGSKQWVEFSLAVSTGTQQNQKTMWVKCLIFGKSAERAKEKIFKGDTIYVSGKIDATAYINKANKAALDVSMFVNEWQLIRSKNEENVQHKVESDPPQYDGTQLDSDLDNIPF